MIEAFGNFVTAGNFAVGLVVFVNLMIINLMVITKGAGRLYEVWARLSRALLASGARFRPRWAL